MRKTKEVKDVNLLLRLLRIISSHSSTVLPPFTADEKPPEAGFEPDSDAPRYLSPALVGEVLISRLENRTGDRIEKMVGSRSPI